MGSDLVEGLSDVQRIYERADELLDLPLSEICREGPEDRRRRTENAQPAILVRSYAIWRALPEQVRQGAAVAAGHSLGELSAYLIADAISFDDALRIVRRRGELMAEAGRERSGTMAAVIGLGADLVADVCRATEGTVVPANYNAPGQVVISCDVEAVGTAGETLREAGARRVIPLNVSGAFHSPLMEGARQELEAMLAGTEIADPVFPVVANVSAEPVETGSRARELLVAQRTGAVRGSDGILQIGQLGISSFMEIGPGSVLTGLLRRIDKGLRGRAVGDLEALRALAAE